MPSPRKIRCTCLRDNGETCDRWLARVENGILYLRCPGCRGYHEEPLLNFLEDMRKLLDEIEEGMEDVTHDDGLWDRKIFG